MFGQTDEVPPNAMNTTTAAPLDTWQVITWTELFRHNNVKSFYRHTYASCFAFGSIRIGENYFAEEHCKIPSAFFVFRRTNDHRQVPKTN